MKYGLIARLIRLAFSKTAYDYIAQTVPELDIEDFKQRVDREYRAIVRRTPSVGSVIKNDLVVALYAACCFTALYKSGREHMSDEVVKGLVRAVSFCPAMLRAKKGKSPFTKAQLRKRAVQAEWSRETIDRYPMNWFYYFKRTEGKDEYFVTHKQCAICKLARQEGCEEVTRYLCAMDYYAFELQGAVLDRTKTLGFGDDECNFHVMSPERAAEIRFVPGPDAK